MVGLWLKNFTFSVLSSLKLNFSTNFLDITCVATMVYRADTDNILKNVNFTCTQETRKLEFEEWENIPHGGQNLILQQITSFEFTSLAV